MTPFVKPVADLPNGGKIVMPDTTAPEHLETVRSLAMNAQSQQRRDGAADYATRLFDSENGQLEAVCVQDLATLRSAMDHGDLCLSRHRETLAEPADTKAVVSSEQIVRRDRMAVATTWIGIGSLVAFAAAEGKLLSNVIVGSGLLALDPDSYWDWGLAVGFGLLPLALGQVKYAHWRGLPTSAARAVYALRVGRHLRNCRAWPDRDHVWPDAGQRHAARRRSVRGTRRDGQIHQRRAG